MTQLITIFISGGVGGAIVAMIASGLVLSYSTSGIFNFSHGAIAWSSAYVFFLCDSGFHWPAWAAAVVAIGVWSPLLGLGLDRAVFRNLSRAPSAQRVVGTIGVLLAVPAIMLFVVETILIDHFHVGLPKVNGVISPPGIGPVPRHTWVIANGAIIDSNQLIVFGTAVVMAIGLWIVVRHTRLGLYTRATVDRNRLASLRGVNTSSVSATSWVLSMLLAGAAGVVGAPIVGVNPDNWTLVLFVAAGAAVIGRLRSIPIALAAGLALGILQNAVATYVTSGVFSRITGLRTAVPSLVLLVGLFLLSRSRQRSAGTSTEAVVLDDGRAELPIWRRWLPWIVSGGGLLVYAMFYANGYWQGLIALGFATAFVFLSITVITGLGGVVSFAQGTLVSMSAIITGYVASHVGAPLIVAMLVGVLSAVVLGTIIALPSLRLDGLGLSLATLSLAFLGSQVLFQIPDLQNNGAGWLVPPIKFGFVDLSGLRALCILMLVMFLLGTWAVTNLRRSAWGRSVLAMRDSLPAARSVGIYPARTKLAIFAVSAAFAGIGGVLISVVQGQATADQFSPSIGLIWVASAAVFGFERPAGALVAGIASTLAQPILDNFTTSTYIPNILFGLGAVGLAAHPEGALTQTSRMLRDLRQKLSHRKRTTEVAPDSGNVPADASVAPKRTGPAAVPADAVLVLEGIRAGYDGVEVLHGIDLAVARGSITVLLGANGAGKSTLSSVVSGWLTPTGGRVVVEGRDATRQPAHQRSRAGVSLVPEGRGVFPSLSVDENLALWLPQRSDREAVYEQFPLLAARRTATAYNLSGGEQQILSLSPFTIRPPRLLVADEPTLGLAPLVVQQLIDIFSSLRDQGTSVLLVEEKALDVVGLADQVVLLGLGRVTWQGTPDQLDTSQLADAYLGVAADADTPGPLVTTDATTTTASLGR